MPKRRPKSPNYGTPEVASLVEQNAPLVRWMLKRYRPWITHRSQAYDAHVSDGMLALMRAAARFDPKRGFQFTTYACRAILMAFNNVGSRRKRDPQGHKVGVESVDFQQTRHRRKSASRAVLAVDAAEITPMLLDSLNDRQRSVVVMRIFNGDTLQEVATRLGITRERVRQIQNGALRIMRERAETLNIDKAMETDE